VSKRTFGILPRKTGGQQKWGERTGGDPAGPNLVGPVRK